MESPKKTELVDLKWNTISQVAEKWGRSEDYVLQQIMTKKLIPSFYFYRTECRSGLFDTHFGNCIDEYDDYTEISAFVSPIFFDWNKTPVFMTTKSDWTCDLGGICFIDNIPIITHLCSSNKINTSDWKIYCPKEPKIVGLNDLLISDEELKRFEADSARKIANIKEADRSKIKDNVFLDPNHKYYSKELAMAVNVWITLYGNDKIKTNKSQKTQIKALLQGNGFSDAAIDRIATVVNPNKEGGAPPSDTK